jgi:hypothetical protein
MIFTAASLAKVADLHENTIRGFLKSGKIKGEFIGGKYIIDEDEANKFIACRLFDNLHKGARIW